MAVLSCEQKCIQWDSNPRQWRIRPERTALDHSAMNAHVNTPTELFNKHVFLNAFNEVLDSQRRTPNPTQRTFRKLCPWQLRAMARGNQREQARAKNQAKLQKEGKPKVCWWTVELTTCLYQKMISVFDGARLGHSALFLIIQRIGPDARTLRCECVCVRHVCALY